MSKAFMYALEFGLGNSTSKLHFTNKDKAIAWASTWVRNNLEGATMGMTLHLTASEIADISIDEEVSPKIYLATWTLIYKTKEGNDFSDTKTLSFFTKPQAENWLASERGRLGGSSGWKESIVSVPLVEKML